MLSLYDREWKEFFIDDIFDVSGSITTKPNLLKTHGITPRITCAATNNGLDNFYRNTPTETGGVLTVDSATIGTVFYQDFDFIATDHVEKMTLKTVKMDKYIGLFLKSAIDKAKDNKFNYGYKFSQSRIKRQKILLPITSEDKPDYDFMEQYVREREYSLKQKHLEFLGDKWRIGGGVTPPSEKKWKEFFIVDIFSLESTSSGIDGNKLSNEQGDIPYLTRTDLNNGYKSFVGQQAGKYEKDSGNCITIGLDTQTAFYQPHSFYTGQNVQVLKNEKLNKYNAKFFIPLLHNAMASLNWGGNGATLGRLRKKKIIIPITDYGQPDYEYMTQYVKSVMHRKYASYLKYNSII